MSLLINVDMFATNQTKHKAYNGSYIVLTIPLP
jgi:hypothetical protein